MPRVGTRTWPEDWNARRAGIGCPMCAQGRAEETHGGLRFFAGQVADVYPRKSGPLPGYSMAVWRGDHAADFVDLTDEQLTAYWRDVTTAAKALYAVFEPAQLNYLTYGDDVPHLHTYLLPRYLDDTSPGRPLQPWAEERVPDARLRQHLARLTTVIRA